MMKSFKPKERVKRNPKRNKIAFAILVVIIGLLINNAIMSHDNDNRQIKDKTHLKEVE